MSDVVIRELNEQGEALEWAGDLLSIAEELLTQWEHPETESILFKIRYPERYWLESWLALPWFLRQMNAHTDLLGSTFTGEVLA